MKHTIWDELWGLLYEACDIGTDVLVMFGIAMLAGVFCRGV